MDNIYSIVDKAYFQLALACVEASCANKAGLQSSFSIQEVILNSAPPDPQAPLYGRKLVTNLQLNITTPLLVWVFPWDPFLTYLA